MLAQYVLLAPSPRLHHRLRLGNLRLIKRYLCCYLLLFRQRRQYNHQRFHALDRCAITTLETCFFTCNFQCQCKHLGFYATRFDAQHSTMICRIEWFSFFNTIDHPISVNAPQNGIDGEILKIVEQPVNFTEWLENICAVNGNIEFVRDFRFNNPPPNLDSKQSCVGKLIPPPPTKS